MTFKVLVNGQEFVSDTYDAFVRDEQMWSDIQEASGFQGTGGDWRYIGLRLDSAIKQAIKFNHQEQWCGIYKPYSVPAIGFYIGKEEI